MIFNIPANESHIAVGLSGGGDSMALTHMLCAWAAKNNKTIHALTVDHGLRDDSGDEARRVAEWVADFPCLVHTILKWDHIEKPAAAIMERARESRYDLMANYCRDHNIKALCIAHHADDQAETFFFRLAKGSGLDGLCAMAEWGMRDGINLYRPLLDMTHNELIKYCKNKQLQWVDDLSNEDKKYARPRLRAALSHEGLDAKRMVKTVERLQRAREALDWMVEKALENTVSSQRKLGYHDVREHDPSFRWDDIIVDYAVLKTMPPDIQIRVIQKMLMQCGGTLNGYPPKLERVEDIVATLKPSQSATLFGCVLSLAKDGKTLAVRRA